MYHRWFVVIVACLVTVQQLHAEDTEQHEKNEKQEEDIQKDFEPELPNFNRPFRPDVRPRPASLSSTWQDTSARACSETEAPPVLIAGSGLITSPNFPDNYPSLSFCRWIIDGGDRFVSLEPKFFCTEDGFDLLSVYDGPNSSSPLITTGTGCSYLNVANARVTTSQRFMYVRFTSDVDTELSGFSASYEADSHLKVCDIEAVAYSSPTGGCNSSSPAIVGFVKLDGDLVWQAGTCGNSSTSDNQRGVNTLIVNMADCSASDIRRFDTSINTTQGALLLASYIDYLRPGELLVGVTGDEPRRQLDPALAILNSAGVDVVDVQTRGNFAFVIQKGFPSKTELVKSRTNRQLTSQLHIVAEGTTTENFVLLNYV